MRSASLALVALLFACPTAHAQDTEKAAADPWLGCWTRVYDAAHLAKHPGQQVTRLTLSISERKPSGDKNPGKYLATITIKMRNGGDTYTNLDGARCSEANGSLTCTTDGFYLGQFSLEPAAKNMKIALGAAITWHSFPVSIDAFVVLSPRQSRARAVPLAAGPSKDLRS